MATEDLLILKYNGLIELQKLNESGPLSNLSVTRNATYSSRSTGEEFKTYQLKLFILFVCLIRFFTSH